jgi:hypothetical protein
VNAHSRWGPVASYGVGVWGGLTAWAALPQYVLPGRGHTLGKLGSFHWVLLINVFPALLCALGFALGLAVVRRPATSSFSSRRVALALGLVFPLSVWLLGPVFHPLGAGMIPALVWCVLGSAGACYFAGRFLS